MTASSFLVELCCGCCIQRDHEADWRRRRSNHHHRSSRHRSQHEQGGYYKYYSRSERGGEASRHSSHPQAKRAPSSHKIVERQSSPLHRPDGRRNSDSSRIKDEHNKTYSTLSSRRRDDASVMGASLCETYQGYLVDDEDDDEYLDEQSAIRRSLKDTRRSRKKPMNDRQKSERQYESEPEPTLSSIKKSKLETYMEEENKRSQSQPRSRRDEAFDNVTTISKASLNPYRVLGLSQGASPREVYDSYKRRQKETHPTASGGSDQAFQNVQNAYRRLRAELKRQESRKERKSSSNGAEKSDSKIKSSRKKSKNRRKDPTSDDEDDNIDKRRQSIDGRLKDHRALVHDLFANDAKESAQKISSNSSVTSIGHVTTLQEAVYGQSRALMALSLVPIEAGATNINEKKKTIHNNCFYLSLAASYLSGAGAFEKDPTAVYFLNSLGKLRKKSTMTSDSSVASTQTLDMAIASLPSTEKKLTMALALQLKRAIEAAVVLVHPNWASDGMVGEEVQAFSDFLVYALDSDSVLGHWAIAVFDEASGFVDVYRGRHYGKVYPPKRVKSKRYNSGLRGKKDRTDDPKTAKYRYKACDEFTRRAQTLTLRYIPGHYQPLLPELTKMKGRSTGNPGLMRPSLEDILNTLDTWKVLHVVTDGRA